MLSQQIKNELPADLLLNIMQYACYKTHDNAKMIKQAVKDKVQFYRINTLWRGTEEHAVEYIERDCAMMFKEVDIHDWMIEDPVYWFELITEQYADCSDEFRNNLIIYSQMIRDVECRTEPRDWVQARRQQRAWGLYKIISDCPTSVY